MTYAALLIRFLITPIIVLTFLIIWDRTRNRRHGTTLQGRSPFMILGALVGIAILYTSPWDSHLIVIRVWWYRPALVSGISFSSIPLEELIFFPLQTLFIGIWFVWLVPRVASRGIAANGGHGVGEDTRSNDRANMAPLIASVVGGCLWLVALLILRLGWRPGTYLGWELVWALPPLTLQLGLGGDILWTYRRLVCAVVIPVVVYLSSVDTLAIHEGIWTIDPHQSLGILLGGQLPLEELVFFSVTTALVVFGLVLGVATESRRRFHRYQAALRGK